MIIQPLSSDAAAASPPISNNFLMVLLSVTHEPRTTNGAVRIFLAPVMVFMVFRDDHDDVAMPCVPMLIIMDDATTQHECRGQHHDHQKHLVHSRVSYATGSAFCAFLTH